jgi:Protein of unknown function (DUF3558)
MRWRQCAAVIPLLAAAAACTTTTAGAPAPQNTTAGAPAPRIPDRDEGGVMAALRQIDACRVVDPAALAAAGLPGAQAVPQSPHTCALTADESLGDKVTVTLGDNFGHGVRYNAAPLTTAGDAKAYLENVAVGYRASCWVDIPVSFQKAIRIAADAGFESHTDVCALAKAAADSAATKLASPDALTVDPASRPLSTWDACSLLATALGSTANQYSLDPRFSLDECGTISQATRGSQPDTGAPVDTPTPSVRISYNGPLDVGQTRQIGDKTATVTGDDPTHCMVTWSQGPSGSTDKLHSDVAIEVQGGPCDQTSAVAAAVMAAIPTTPPSAPPQRPLLYGAGDPDDDAPGACIDFTNMGNTDGCNPAHEVAVPHGAAAILAAADADSNINCAIAHDAIKAVAGAGEHFAPVTYADFCFFVEPTHTIQFTVDVDDKYAPDEYGKHTDVYSNRTQITIAGHPAIVFDSSEGTEHEVYVSTGNDVDQPGFVHTDVHVLPQRGTPPDTKADPAKTQHVAEDVATRIMQQFFG